MPFFPAFPGGLLYRVNAEEYIGLGRSSSHCFLKTIHV